MRELLVNTEVIGGDLLMKRAHQAFINGPHPVPNETSPDFSDLIKLSGDLSVAQDYENYLNNREAINALMAANPDTAFTAGWIATFARVNDLKLNHVQRERLPRRAGRLSRFGQQGRARRRGGERHRQARRRQQRPRRDQGGEWRGDAGRALGVRRPPHDHQRRKRQTLQFTVDSGLGESGTQIRGDGGAISPAAAATTSWSAARADDTIGGGAGWDFIDGGPATTRFRPGRQRHPARRLGNDDLLGGPATTPMFSTAATAPTPCSTNSRSPPTRRIGKTSGETRTGTGSNEFDHDWIPETTTDHPNAGKDSLVFGPGIAISDVAVQISADGQNLIVGVRDPAHPGQPFGQLADTVTLRNWNDPLDRIEAFVFADGNVLNTGTALGSYLVPFGEKLSHNSVAESAAIGTLVGTVSTFDLEAGAVLTYSLVNNVAGNPFAVNASTGAISVAAALNFEGTPAWPLTVRATDQNGHFVDKSFEINVTNVNEAPADITLSGGSAPENSPGGTIIATAHGVDPDAGTALHYSLTDDAGGRFVIYQGGEIAIVNGGLIDYETASAYHIKVRAADQHGLVVEKDFTLHVTDVYEGSFGFDPATTPLADFTIGAGGWASQDRYPRLLADVNGDGMDDIIGFGADAVVVSLATGGGHFASPVLGIANYTVLAGGWNSQDRYPRLLADVNGDGMADIVGFGADAVVVSLATGGGHFASPVLGITNYTVLAGGWNSQDRYPRQLADVNGDGMADIVGFGADAVVVSLATGGGHFAPAVLGITSYTLLAGGWSSQDRYPRLLADVNGDGKADIVGFGADGVAVSLATGGGHFASPVSGIAGFGYLDSAGGWTSQNQVPRLLADVNGDGMADIAGFAADMAIVSLATGGGHFAAPLAGYRGFTFSSGGWVSEDVYPRQLGDVNGDGLADIIGFAYPGVVESLSNGFAPTDITLSGGSAPEDSVGGTIIATAHGIDPFPGAVLTYSLTDNAGGRFLIYQGGEIAIVHRPLMDFETAGAYHVTVRAADQYGSHVDRDFTLHVTDVNEKPTDITLSGGSAPENSPGGTIIATAHGVDPDAGTALHYSLTDDAGGRFLIYQGGEIAIVNGGLIDYETASSYHIKVKAADQYGLFVEKDFTLHVTDVYEGPTGFGPVTAPLAAFGIGAGGWSDQNHYPRLLADVNGDHMDDIVAFGDSAVLVSLATGNGQFASPVFGIANFTTNTGWSSQDLYPRQLADVNGDGMADIVAFGPSQVAVSLATGGGHFGTPMSEITNYTAAIGWSSQDLYPRQLADVNGDGMADIVAFGPSQVAVSLATGGGHFDTPMSEITNYTASHRLEQPEPVSAATRRRQRRRHGRYRRLRPQRGGGFARHRRRTLQLRRCPELRILRPMPAAGTARINSRGSSPTSTATTWPISSASAATLRWCRWPPEAATSLPRSPESTTSQSMTDGPARTSIRASSATSTATATPI